MWWRTGTELVFPDLNTITMLLGPSAWVMRAVTLRTSPDPLLFGLFSRVMLLQRVADDRWMGWDLWLHLISGLLALLSIRGWRASGASVVLSLVGGTV